MAFGETLQPRTSEHTLFKFNCALGGNDVVGAGAQEQLVLNRDVTCNQNPTFSSDVGVFPWAFGQIQMRRSWSVSVR